MSYVSLKKKKKNMLIIDIANTLEKAVSHYVQLSTDDAIRYISLGVCLFHLSDLIIDSLNMNELILTGKPKET